MGLLLSVPQSLIGSYEWQSARFPQKGDEEAILKNVFPPHFVVYSQKSEVIKLIYRWANYYDVDFELALLIAKSESQFNPLAKNPKSSAGGVYQWLTSSWLTMCEGDKFNAEANIRCAMKTIANGGISHWRADPVMRDIIDNYLKLKSR